MEISINCKNGEQYKTIVSPEDYYKVTNHKYKWCISSTKKQKKYIYGKDDNGKRISLHQFIIGKAKEGYVIDHINGNSFDNRRENLRCITYSQNN
jgi:hypothetical protein